MWFYYFSGVLFISFLPAPLVEYIHILMFGELRLQAPRFKKQIQPCTAFDIDIQKMPYVAEYKFAEAS